MAAGGRLGPGHSQGLGEGSGAASGGHGIRDGLGVGLGLGASGSDGVGDGSAAFLRWVGPGGIQASVMAQVGLLRTMG